VNAVTTKALSGMDDVAHFTTCERSYSTDVGSLVIVADRRLTNLRRAPCRAVVPRSQFNNYL